MRTKAGSEARTESAHKRLALIREMIITALVKNGAPMTGQDIRNVFMPPLAESSSMKILSDMARGGLIFYQAKGNKGSHGARRIYSHLPFEVPKPQKHFSIEQEFDRIEEELRLICANLTTMIINQESLMKGRIEISNKLDLILSELGIKQP